MRTLCVAITVFDQTVNQTVFIIDKVNNHWSRSVNIGIIHESITVEYAMYRHLYNGSFNSTILLSLLIKLITKDRT